MLASRLPRNIVIGSSGYEPEKKPAMPSMSLEGYVGNRGRVQGGAASSRRSAPSHGTECGDLFKWFLLQIRHFFGAGFGGYSQ